MQPGLGPGASDCVHSPHQPRRGGRGGMARAAAGRPAASAAGQERSPRPPSGCGGQSSGDSARPSANLSQLACAAQLSNIHLRGSSPVAPFQEPGKKKKKANSLQEGSRGLSGRRAGERRGEECVTGRPPRRCARTRVLLGVQSLLEGKAGVAAS